MSKPIVVYLDSSDFSVMSDPRQAPAHEETRTRCAEWAECGSVQFVFSGIHLMEMSPTDAAFAPAATARADLMVDLCRRNALISIDRLIGAELDRIKSPNAPTPVAISPDAQWYPAWGDMVSPVQWADASKEVYLNAKEHGMNRQQRRLLKRALFKEGRPTKLASQILADGETPFDTTELLERYPMREQDAQVLVRYVLGQGTAEEANEAFYESLRDPSWMMRWFAQHHSQLSPFVAWLRDSAHGLLAPVEGLFEFVKRMQGLPDLAESNYPPDLLTTDGWARFQDETLLNVTRRFMKVLRPDIAVQFTAEEIDRRCPAISSFVRSLHSAIRDVTSKTPRRPKASDFADGLHAMYAPYVDIFRADAYMAGHMKRLIAPHGTIIVPKLDQLVAAIEERFVQ